MADELKVKIGLSLERGSNREKIDPGVISIDVAADPISAGVMTVGTSAEALPVGDVATLGVLYLQNLDATNFVLWGPDDGGTMKDCGKILPGEAWPFRLKPGITLKLKADTAACSVRYWLASN